jgi:hypothetical protein
MFIFKAPFTAWEIINNTVHVYVPCSIPDMYAHFFVDTVGTSALLEKIEKFRRDGCQVLFRKRLPYKWLNICVFTPDSECVNF